MKKICSLVTSPLMTSQLLPCFKNLGYETSYFPCRSWMIMSKDEGLKWLEHDLKNSKCDLLIFGGNFPPYFLEIANLCKKYKCKYLYWAIEDPVCFEHTLKMAKTADFVFTTTIECIQKYKTHKIDAELLLFACTPEYHKPGKFVKEYEYDCVLQASYYTWKPRLEGYNIILDPALKLTNSISVWGAGWADGNGKIRLGKHFDKYKGYFGNNLLGDLCESSKIILGVQCDNTSISQISMRPFEVLACGGFHLTQWTKAKIGLYADGQHLLTSKSKEETEEIIKYYLNHEDERNKIRTHGMEFVRQNHTYYHRINDVILPHIKKLGGF